MYLSTTHPSTEHRRLPPRPGAVASSATTLAQRPTRWAWESVTKNYGKRTVLRDVSLQVESGSLLCVVGESGCGKTTLLRLMAGLIRPEQGRITAGEKIISSASAVLPPEKRRMGIVFQDSALFPHLNVRDNIAFGLRGTRQQKRTDVERWLQLVGLPTHSTRYPHELSGGQAQRVALARALAPNPQLLLLDEPFSHLDRPLREALWHDLLPLLRQRTMTTVLVTHDQQEALGVADRLAVLVAGCIVQQGTPQDVLHRPRTRAIAEFIGPCDWLPAEAEGERLHTELGTVDADQIACIEGAVLVRPNDVRLDPQGCAAQVETVQYQGIFPICTLRLPSRATVRALLPIEPRLGMRVCVSLAVPAAADGASQATRRVHASQGR